MPASDQWNPGSYADPAMQASSNGETPLSQTTGFGQVMASLFSCLLFEKNPDILPNMETMSKVGPGALVSQSLKSQLLIGAIVCGLFGGGFGASSARAAVGDTATWVFDAPAIGNPAQNPPYVPVGTVSLLQTKDGVQFTLTPNKTNTGYQNNAFINQLFYAYIGSKTLTSDSFESLSTNLQGTSAAAASFGVARANGTEAGYNPLTIQVNWGTSNAHGGKLRLQPDETTSWLALGTTISDFAPVATANNKPSPMTGVLSLSGFSGNSSNWVASQVQVPEPGTYVMMLVGVLLLAGYLALSRARKVG